MPGDGGSVPSSHAMARRSSKNVGSCAVTSGVLPGIFGGRAEDKNQAYVGPENETPSDVTFREVLCAYFTRTGQNVMHSADMELANGSTFQQASLRLQSVSLSTHKAMPLKAKDGKVARASSKPPPEKQKFENTTTKMVKYPTTAKASRHATTMVNKRSYTVRVHCCPPSPPASILFHALPPTPFRRPPSSDESKYSALVPPRVGSGAGNQTGSSKPPGGMPASQPLRHHPAIFTLRYECKIM